MVYLKKKNRNDSFHDSNFILLHLITYMMLRCLKILNYIGNILYTELFIAIIR
jgi:hypothetical protein